MPEIIVCGYCGCILYNDDELLSPSEVLRRHDGRCPKCSAMLRIDALNIEVKAKNGEEKLEVFKALKK